MGDPPALSFSFSPHYPTRAPLLNSRTIWIFAILLTLLVHLLGFYLPITWLTQVVSPPVSVKTISPADLAKMKREWQKLAPMVDPRPDQPAADSAPENARYASDRNLKVQKESRAKNGETLPRFNGPAPTASPLRPRPRAKERPLPKLASLGIPYTRPQERSPTQTNQTAEERRRANTSARSNETPAEQYLRDSPVPEGSETLLNAIESVNYSFIRRIREQIGPNYQSRARTAIMSGAIRLGQGLHEAAVEVELDPDGKLMDVRLVKSSGDLALDEIVMRVWRLFDRYPQSTAGTRERR